VEEPGNDSPATSPWSAATGSKGFPESSKRLAILGLGSVVRMLRNDIYLEGIAQLID